MIVFNVLKTLAGLALILLFLIDAFESVLQPRRVTHRFRFARLYYRNTWLSWRFLALRLPAGKKRDAFLGVFGPLSLLALFLSWVVGLIVGFALVNWGLPTPIRTDDGIVNFVAYLYMSGTTFFTLGYGDVTPLNTLGRALAVIESGMGFAFLAMIIGYLPVFYQAFSKREVTISLLDARASSPPSAGQILVRLAAAKNLEHADTLLIEWEQWSAELLESHLSFPVLGYYRSQHDNQSWLAAVTCMLDTCAILLTQVKGFNPYRAQLTFAMARHAIVDLCLILKISPTMSYPDRLPAETQAKLSESLRRAGVPLADDASASAKLAELRGMYEPFVSALCGHFLLALPAVVPDAEPIDNWQRSAGMRRAPGLGSLPSIRQDDEHFS